MDEVERVQSEETESVCPVCLKRIGARRVARGGEVFLVKQCIDHGPFTTVIWRGAPSMAEWTRPKERVHPGLCYGTANGGCPFDCGLCEAHEQLPCSVLIELTGRCNLRCPVCFADSGDGRTQEPPLPEILPLFERAMAAAGPCNLQLSGGEPTLRDDVPEIIEAARRAGYSFIQINTNGLRLAADAGYGRRLADAGLSSVFLQFDGVDDEVYRSLRGRPLLDAKLRAVGNCEKAGLGVVLVPTIVNGVNTGVVGSIIRQAMLLAPAVRGVHFQPISYFGRYPGRARDGGRFTLPELMRCIEEQTKGLLKVADFSPPGCEHARCSFHATYMLSAGGELRPIGPARADACCQAGTGTGGVKKTVESVSRRWRLPAVEEAPPHRSRRPGNSTDVVRVEGPLDFDLFLGDGAARSFTVSAMAFQDADNLDLERLRGCCISVISADGRLIPFCAYNLTARDGRGLYRGVPVRGSG